MPLNLYYLYHEFTICSLVRRLISVLFNYIVDNTLTLNQRKLNSSK